MRCVWTAIGYLLYDQTHYVEYLRRAPLICRGLIGVNPADNAGHDAVRKMNCCSPLAVRCLQYFIEIESGPFHRALGYINDVGGLIKGMNRNLRDTF